MSKIHCVTIHHRWKNSRMIYLQVIINSFTEIDLLVFNLFFIVFFFRRTTFQWSHNSPYNWCYLFFHIIGCRVQRLFLAICGVHLWWFTHSEGIFIHRMPFAHLMKMNFDCNPPTSNHPFLLALHLKFWNLSVIYWLQYYKCKSYLFLLTLNLNTKDAWS